MMPIERNRRKTAKAMLDALALFTTNTTPKIKNRPDFIS
jgi:phage/plasmid-associated DNA primase